MYATCVTCGSELQRYQVSRETDCCATAQCFACNEKEPVLGYVFQSGRKWAVNPRLCDCPE